MRCSTERVPTRSQGLDGRGAPRAGLPRTITITTTTKPRTKVEGRGSCSGARPASRDPRRLCSVIRLTRAVCLLRSYRGFWPPQKPFSRQTVRVSFPLAERHLDETSAFSLRDTMPGVSRSATDRGKASDAFPSGNEDCSRRSIGPSPHRPRSLAAAGGGKPASNVPYPSPDREPPRGRGPARLSLPALPRPGHLV